MHSEETLEKISDIKHTISSALSIIVDPTEDHLEFLDNHYREEFIRNCNNSNDCRLPAEEDLNRWWPRSAASRKKKAS